MSSGNASLISQNDVSGGDNLLKMFLIGHDSINFSLLDKIHVAGLILFQAFFANFIRLCLVDGSYPFLFTNLYTISSALCSIVLFFRVPNAFQNVTLRMFFFQVIGNFGGVLYRVFFAIGIGMTSVQIAATIWFTKIILNAILDSVVKNKIPGLQMVWILAGTGSLILVCICQSLTTSDLTQNVALGISVLLFASFSNSMADVLRDFIGKEFIDFSKEETLFWGFFTQMIVNYCSIPIEAMVEKGSVEMADFIPGHNMHLRSYLYCFFYIGMAYFVFAVGFKDINVYMSCVFTGTFLSSILAEILSGFAHFEPVTFGCNVTIFLNALAYQNAYEEHERKKEIARLQKLLLESDEGKIIEILHWCRDLKKKKKSKNV